MVGCRNACKRNVRTADDKDEAEKHSDAVEDDGQPDHATALQLEDPHHYTANDIACQAKRYYYGACSGSRWLQCWTAHNDQQKYPLSRMPCWPKS